MARLYPDYGADGYPRGVVHKRLRGYGAGGGGGGVSLPDDLDDELAPLY